MFSGVAGNGLRSARPPTVILCFTPCANAVSMAPGCRAWHPASARSRTASTPLTSFWACRKFFTISLHHDLHVHVAVVGAAEVIADWGKRPRGLRCDRD